MIIKDRAYVEVDKSIYEMWITALYLSSAIDSLSDEGFVIGLTDFDEIKTKLSKLMEPLENELTELLHRTMIASDDIEFQPNFD